MDRRMMSYTNYDFPHTHYYDTDLRELIDMYVKITKEVDEILAWKNDQYHDYEDLIKKVAKLEEDVENCIDAIDKQNQKIANDFARYEQQMDNKFQIQMNSFTNMFNTLAGDITGKLTEMQIQLNNFNVYLANELAKNNAEVYRYVDSLFDYFVAHLPDYENLIIYNPVRGEMTNVQTAINDLYSSLNIYGLTAIQYDTLSLTAAEYDAYQLTALEYDRLGYILLGYPDTRYYMIDPFTGETTLIKNVVYKLAQLHMDGLSALEYDNKILTAQEYDSKLITAFNYDWFGKQLLA